MFNIAWAMGQAGGGNSGSGAGGGSTFFSFVPLIKTPFGHRLSDKSIKIFSLKKEN